MKDIRKLDLLMEVLVKLFSTGDYGVNHLEWLFNDIHKILQSNLDARNYFFKKLEANIKCVVILNDINHIPENYIDSDLLAFIAHVTRWKEFYQYVYERKKYINSSEFDLADLISDAL